MRVNPVIAANWIKRGSCSAVEKLFNTLAGFLCMFSAALCAFPPYTVRWIVVCLLLAALIFPAIERFINTVVPYSKIL